MSEPSGIAIVRCESCHSRFLPRSGPCPHCGASALTNVTVPPRGVVLAAVELLAPAAGWPAPHRIVMVELAEDVRLLAVCPGPLPSIGDSVVVAAEGTRFRVGEGEERMGRGEGDAPTTGVSRPPFEPPR